MERGVSDEGIRIPDLLIAFNVDRAGIIDKRGYAIEREGNAAGLCAGGGITDDEDDGLHGQARRLRGLRNIRILAVRRIGRPLPRRGSGRRPAWSTEAIIPLPWNGRTTPTVAVPIAKPWGYTSAGKTDGCGGTILRAGATCALLMKPPPPCRRQAEAPLRSGLKTSAASANDGGHTATRCFDSVSAGH